MTGLKVEADRFQPCTAGLFLKDGFCSEAEADRVRPYADCLSQRLMELCCLGVFPCIFFERAKYVRRLVRDVLEDILESWNILDVSRVRLLLSEDSSKSTLSELIKKTFLDLWNCLKLPCCSTGESFGEIESYHLSNENNTWLFRVYRGVYYPIYVEIMIIMNHCILEGSPLNNHYNGKYEGFLLWLVGLAGFLFRECKPSWHFCFVSFPPIIPPTLEAT